jgi:2-oxoisovalerate ferredoxin oxidoreductase beta subunit
MPEYQTIRERPHSFYTTFERKAELQHQTHYCPGCGHGIVSKLLAQAIDELGIQDRTVLISPVGCSVFGYYYFDTGNVQVAHGRAPAAATGVKRARPDSIVIAYQGDGDLAAIGTAEIIHAANRGEAITVIFVNNGIYGMTGGQMAPTTPLGKKSTTTPFGRSAATEGFPLHVCELLNSLEAPVFIERVALGNNKQIMNAAKVIKRAVENQVKGLGFSFVEVLSPCPTIWKMTPLEAQSFVREEMAHVFGLGNHRDRTKEALARPAPAAAPAIEDLPGLLGLTPRTVKLSGRLPNPQPPAPSPLIDFHVKVAGFGGQGVLMLGEVLAEAALESGYHVSWLPSYGPEMRSGTSNCHVRIAAEAIDSPLVSRPNVLLALNEPSLRKFLPAVEAGGIVLYNGPALPSGCERPDVRMIARDFTSLADQLGSAKACNIVMLGALLEATSLLEQEAVEAALRRIVKSERWLEIDFAALARGREETRVLFAMVIQGEDYLWGV